MRSAKEIWEATKGALQVQVNKANYETWLKDTIGVSHQGNQFVVGTPRAFAKEWLEKRFHSLVRKTLINVIGQDIEVHFQVCPPLSRVSEGHELPPNPSLGRIDSLPPTSPPFRINPKYTFDNFVVGSSNRLAFAAALGVTEEPGHRYNPLFIYGESGLGKTHLVHAIGNQASESGFKVTCVSSEQFTNEFIGAIKEKRTEEFRHKFRSADLFLLEDIQFIGGKPQTQESLLHTFNELHNANHQLVITSDRPPELTPLSDSKLNSRLEWGLVAQVQAPDLETRLAILYSKAERQKVQIDKSVFEFVAQRCQSNVRELEGALTRLIAYAKMMQKDPSLELAEQILQVLNYNNPPVYALTPTSILAAVADHFKISPAFLKSRKRDSQLTLARQIAIYLIREKTNCPLHDIGKLFGGREHSTILRSYHKIATKLFSDPLVQRNVTQILTTLPQ
jgi:chromosomal replication initiator protein